MIGELKELIQDRLFSGQERSVRAKKHIVASFVIKGVSILTGFLLVPLTLDYVATEQYGIWLTLSSVIAWFSFFDIGLGHGMRNKVAEALAVGDREKAKIYISTTYAILGAIFSFILLAFLLINPLLNWSNILNTSIVSQSQLALIAAITFAFFCINFVLRLIYSIFLADQRPAYRGIVNLIANIIALLIIFVLTKTTEGSLLYLAVVMSISPLVVLLAASLIFFTNSYDDIAPSIKYVRLDHFNDLIGLGFKFFVVGITSLIIFSTDNVIIIQLFGPNEVPAYQVAHKYFGLITQAFAIISVPFWSAYTDAFIKKDISWIRNTNKKLIQIWLVLTVASLLLLLIAKPFYQFWVPQIEVPFLLSLMMCVYVVTLAWGNIFVMFINGVGKVKLQLVVSLIGAVFNIPLSYIFSKTLNMGSSGVILASTICIMYGPLLAPIQFEKILSGNAKGIWNK